MHKVFIVMVLFMQSCANESTKLVVSVLVQCMAISLEVHLEIYQLLLFHC